MFSMASSKDDTHKGVQQFLDLTGEEVNASTDRHKPAKMTERTCTDFMVA